MFLKQIMHISLLARNKSINSNLSMRMISTLSWNSYPVGVRNLNAKRKKYLFRSLYTKKKDHHLGGLFSFLWLWNRGFSPQCRRHGVRIPRPKIDKLACQAKGEGIFAHSEYPYSAAKKKDQVERLGLFSTKSVLADGINPTNVG